MLIYFLVADPISNYILFNNHFSNLLGNEALLIEEDINKILCEMNIDDGYFRLDELRNVIFKICEDLHQKCLNYVISMI